MNKKLLMIAAASMAAVTGYGQNLLANPDFELDGVTGVAPADWDRALSSATALVSNDYVQSGNYSLAIDSTGAGAFASPNVFQTLPATPGTEYRFSGYMLQPSGNPITDASFGLLKVEFLDASSSLIDVAGLVSTGGAAAAPFFGAESTPFLNGSSAVDEWVFTETVVEAPAGAVEARFLLLNVNESIAPSPVYFDNIMAVPEPSAYAFLGGLAALGFVLIRRRRAS